MPPAGRREWARIGGNKPAPLLTVWHVVVHDPTVVQGNGEGTRCVFYAHGTVLSVGWSGSVRGMASSCLDFGLFPDQAPDERPHLFSTGACIDGEAARVAWRVQEMASAQHVGRVPGHAFPGIDYLHVSACELHDQRLEEGKMGAAQHDGICPLLQHGRDGIVDDPGRLGSSAGRRAQRPAPGHPAPR